MFVHREDMEPLDTHGKEGVDMIVPMDTVECEKAGSDSLLAARTHPFDGDTKQRVYRVAAETTGPSEQNFGIDSGERRAAG
jgi:hypothetical protein